LLRPIIQLIAVLFGQTAVPLYNQSSWLFLIPVTTARSSYSPLLFFSAISALLVIFYFMIRQFYHGRVRRGPAWDCGYPWQTARMQDTAEGFSQPIKQIFASFLQIRLQIPGAFDKHPYYHMEASDRFWYLLYLPVVRSIAWLAKGISKYSFVTLLVLLWWML
jgi:hypothetical protein